MSSDVPVSSRDGVCCPDDHISVHMDAVYPEIWWLEGYSASSSHRINTNGNPDTADSRLLVTNISVSLIFTLCCQLHSTLILKP